MHVCVGKEKEKGSQEKKIEGKRPNSKYDSTSNKQH